MEAKVVKRRFNLEGFPFPFQPPPLPNPLTPPATKSESPESHGGPNDPPHPFLTNVGKLNGTTIVRGGFRIKKEPFEYTVVGMRCYPPPPNAAYGLTSQAHISDNPATLKSKVYTPPSTDDGSDRDVTVDRKCVTGVNHSGSTGFISFNGLKNLDGTATEEVGIAPAKMNDSACIDPIQQLLNQPIRREMEPQTFADALEHDNRRQKKTIGEVLADTIDFKRPSWIMTTPGVSGFLYPAEEQREDYIRFINGDKPELEYCKKCKKTHIPPGPPITLEDRDTCGAYLPEWFPTADYEKPWKDFKKMIDDMVYLTELTQGYNHKPNPDAPVWDLEFHDYSKKWRALGRRGGWWKCRDGEDATDVERECELCHDEKKIKADRKSAGANTRSVVEERLKGILDFIDFHMKRVCEKDKAIVLARARTEGIPQLPGPWAMEEERFQNGGGNRWASFSTIQRSCSMDTTCSSVAYGSPAGDRIPARERCAARGRSPPRGRSPVRRGRE